jgi:hypothetical protein
MTAAELWQNFLLSLYILYYTLSNKNYYYLKFNLIGITVNIRQSSERQSKGLPSCSWQNVTYTIFKMAQNILTTFLFLISDLLDYKTY